MAEIDWDKKLFFEANSKRFLYMNLLKKGCSQCGTKGKMYLSFHHRNPDEKLFDISWGAKRSSITREMFEIELTKCDLLCRVCHKKIHEEQGLKGRHLIQRERLKELSRIANKRKDNGRMSELR